MRLFGYLVGSLLLVFGFFQQAAFAKPMTTAKSAPLMNSWTDTEDWEAQSHLTTGAYETSKAGSTTITTLTASGSFAKKINENMQVGGEVAFMNYSGGASYSGYKLLAIGNYNFSSILKNAWYAKAGLGLYDAIGDTGNHESKFGFFFGGGKRIPLWNQITYTPEARMSKIGSQDFTLAIYLINFSVFF